MALERVPADIRKDGGVSRMSDPKVGAVNFDVISQLSKLKLIESTLHKRYCIIIFECS